MKGIGEECGVAAIYMKNFGKENSKEVPKNLVEMLSSLQHRGQASAGICVYRFPDDIEGKRLKTHKDVGLVSEVFRFNHPQERENIFRNHKGIAGIGHVRYSTSGLRDSSTLEDEAQPFLRRHERRWKRFGIGFNGHIANYEELINNLPDDYDFETKTDTELLLQLIVLGLNEFSQENNSKGIVKPNLFDVSKRVMKQLDGAYALTSIFGDGNLLIVRDSKGLRPMVWGENNKFYAVASESVALKQVLGMSNIREVDPGSALLINQDGCEIKQLLKPRPTLCQFELVYFLKSISSHSGKSVREIRKNLGLKLAEREPLKHLLNDKEWLVVPAPQTAIPASEAYTACLKLPLGFEIEKNETLRGFINESSRRKEIMERIYMVHEGVKGKKIILIDDSLVRAETSKILIEGLRESGASEVHVRFTEPPIKHPCFYGIDFPTREELGVYGCGETHEDIERGIAEKIRADSVGFQRIDDLVDAIGIPEDKLCLACLTGKYPTKAGQRLSLEA